MSLGMKRLLYEYWKGATGHFHTNLFDLIASADDLNLERLRLSYPEEVEVYTAHKTGKFTMQDVEFEIAQERVQNYKKEDECKNQQN